MSCETSEEETLDPQQLVPQLSPREDCLTPAQPKPCNSVATTADPPDEDPLLEWDLLGLDMSGLSALEKDDSAKEDSPDLTFEVDLPALPLAEGLSGVSESQDAAVEVSLVSELVISLKDDFDGSIGDEVYLDDSALGAATVALSDVEAEPCVEDSLPEPAELFPEEEPASDPNGLDANVIPVTKH